jgi:hypothetical protein
MDKQSFSGIYTDIHSLLHQFPLVCEYVTLWLFNVAMERSTIFKFGKPSIPWAIYIYTMAMLVISKGYLLGIIRLLMFVTWWLIPLSKWVITPVISGLTLLIPFITGVISHLLSGMRHQVERPIFCQSPEIQKATNYAINSSNLRSPLRSGLTEERTWRVVTRDTTGFTW